MSAPGSDVSRRHVLGAVSAVVAGGVAGCSGSSDDEPENTTTATATPSPTPTPEPPNLEQRIIQRDGAAVTHIYTLLTGTITWPSFELIDPIDESIVGVWETSSETLALSIEGEFALEGSDYSYSGTYVAVDGELTLHFDSGDTAVFQYERRDDGDGTILVVSQDGEVLARYQRTQQGGSRNVVQAVEDFVVRQEDVPTTQSQDLRVGSTGSGFVVSPTGYIVTNAHVVETQNPELALYRQLAAIKRQELRQGLAEGTDLTDRQREQVEEILFSKIIDYYVAEGSVRNVAEESHVLSGRATPDDDITVESWPASVEAAGSSLIEVDGQPTWGEDVAVVKVDREPLPTVTLGSAEGLQTGEEIVVVGYPTIGIESLFEERNIVLEPTLTTGVVSARRRLRSGINTIQTDAGINNGNSGGPMFNSDGEVVGIATFTTSDEIEEIHFGLPIEIAEQYLDDLGVENRESEMEGAFDEGLEAYWHGDCETAVDRMETVLQRYPQHPYAQGYIDDCENGDAPGQG